MYKADPKPARGRPRTRDDYSEVNFQIPNHLRASIAEIARDEGTTLHEIYNRFLSSGLAHYRAHKRAF
jgi:hypothetical protein